MGKIEITDECLTPEKYTYIKYKGKNPWDVAEKISESAKPFFHISTIGINNARLNWDITGDVRTFFSIWTIKQDNSRFTKTRIELKLQGSQHKDTKMGDFGLQFSGVLVTSFEGWTPLMRPFWYIYSFLFYNRARRRYIQNCQSSIYGFKNEIKKHFGLEDIEAPSAHAALG